MSDTLSISVVVAAGKQRKVDVRGRFIYCRTSSLQEFEMQVDNGSPISFFPGSTWRPKAEFGKLTVKNTSPTDELTATFVIGPEDFELSQFRLTPANRMASLVDVSVATMASAEVLAANLDRQRVIITNPVGNVREFRIGDSLVAADRGVDLFPGDRMELPSTAAVWAFNPDAAAMKISILELME